MLSYNLTTTVYVWYLQCTRNNSITYYIYVFFLLGLEFPCLEKSLKKRPFECSIYVHERQQRTGCLPRTDMFAVKGDVGEVSENFYLVLFFFFCQTDKPTDHKKQSLFGTFYFCWVLDCQTIVDDTCVIIGILQFAIIGTILDNKAKEPKLRKTKRFNTFIPMFVVSVYLKVRRYFDPQVEISLDHIVTLLYKGNILIR